MDVEAVEDRIAESQVELARAQAEWERRVREGDDDPENLLWVAGEIVAFKKEVRDLLAQIASISSKAEAAAESKPGPLDLSDAAAIVAAVRDCFGHWRTEFPDLPEERCWPSAHQVALRLSKQQRPGQRPYPKVTASDRMRTVAALKRLAKGRPRRGDPARGVRPADLQQLPGEGRRQLAMPATQRGTLRKRGASWSARFYDESNVRRERSGFATKSEAGEWLDAKLKIVGDLRDGDVAAVRRRAMPTLAELVDEYLGQHNAEANTLRTLTARLRYATEGPALDGTGGFADIRIDRLNVTELGAWRKRLPERSAWAIHKALRQVLHYAVRAKLLDGNPAVAVPNPEPKRREVPAFGALADVEAVAVELGPSFGAVAVVGALTGLRPRSGSRSSGATSTGPPACSESVASTRTGR